MITSGTRPRRMSSGCRRPASWAAPRRSTHWAAVANATRCPATQARTPRAMERWLLPVPGSVGDEVELVEALAGWEAGGADAGLTAVGLAGRHFPLQAGGEELLVAPGLPASSRHDHRPNALPRGGRRLWAPRS